MLLEGLLKIGSTTLRFLKDLVSNAERKVSFAVQAHHKLGNMGSIYLCKKVKEYKYG